MNYLLVVIANLHILCAFSQKKSFVQYKFDYRIDHLFHLMELKKNVIKSVNNSIDYNY